jgi:CHAT domain-containing protein
MFAHALGVAARSMRALCFVVAAMLVAGAAPVSAQSRRAATPADEERADILSEQFERGGPDTDGAFTELRALTARIDGLESDTYEDLLFDYGRALADRLELDEAEARFAEAGALARRRFPKDPLADALALQEISDIQRVRGDYARAEATYRELHRRQAAAHGEASWAALDAAADLADLLMWEGKFSEAEILLRRRLDLAISTSRQESDLVPALSDLAQLLTMVGAHVEALQLSVRAYNANLEELRYNPLHFERFMDTGFALVAALQRAGRHQEAEARLNAVADTAQRLLESRLLLSRETTSLRILEERNYFFLRSSGSHSALLYARTYRDRLAAAADSQLDRSMVAMSSMLVAVAEYRAGDYRGASADIEVAFHALEGFPGMAQAQIAAPIYALRARIRLAVGDWRAAQADAVRARQAERERLAQRGVTSILTDTSFLDEGHWPQLTEARAIWSQRGRGDDSALVSSAFTVAQITLNNAARGLDISRARAALANQGSGSAFAAYEAAERSLSAANSELSSALSAQGAVRAHLQDARRARESDQASALEADHLRIGQIVDRLVRQRQSAVDAFGRAEATLPPRFVELMNARPASIAQLQSCSGSDSVLLRADEALLLLTPGDTSMPVGHRHGFVFVVTKDCVNPSQSRVSWAELGLEPNELAREITALRSDLDIYRNTRAFEAAPEGGARPATQPSFDRTRANALYHALFGDPEVAALLASKPNWLVAPQGDLLSLPFATLVTEAPAEGRAGDSDAARLRSTHWLGLERTLSILPAVSSLATLRRDQPARAHADQIAFFGVGDPAFASAADAQCRLANGLIRSETGVDIVGRLPRLPCTRRELEAMRSSLGGETQDVLLGARASEPSLRAARDRLARARIVAFATHGLIAGDLGLTEPALALSPPQAGAPRPDDPRAAAEDDGLLTASEAAFLPLSAEWVILSACNTDAGDDSAEGLSGLARAFFYAGARSLLVSQWGVRDDAAARLTTRTITLREAQGSSKAEALREAMREIMSDTSQDTSGHSFAHPATWAPFIFVGAD